MAKSNYKLEEHVNDLVKSQFEKLIKSQPIKLPYIHNQPNYQIMETFISAIQKLVIQDVVVYADEKNKCHKKSYP